jgi:hypothetical protein
MSNTFPPLVMKENLTWLVKHLTLFRDPQVYPTLGGFLTPSSSASACFITIFSTYESKISECCYFFHPNGMGLVWMNYFSFVPAPADLGVDMITWMDRIAILVLDFSHIETIREMMTTVITLVVVLMTTTARSRTGEGRYM